MASYETFRAPSVIAAEEKAKREHDSAEDRRKRAEERAEAHRKEIRRMDNAQKIIEGQQKAERERMRLAREQFVKEAEARAEEMAREYDLDRHAFKILTERNQGFGLETDF